MSKLKEPGVCRIFFSSPFNGMEGEREELTRRYWPEIQALCNSKGLQFVPVDMRWGITTELSNNNQTISICLREIDRSDVFVGFFGQRYGWHGAKDEALQLSFDAAEPSYSWLQDHRGKSVTELEFLHGHLNRPGNMPAVVCFRDKSWDDVERKIGEEKGDKKMIYKYSSESDLATDLMNDLKRRVKVTEKQTLGVHMDYKTPAEGAKLMSDAVITYLQEQLLKDTRTRRTYPRELELAQHDAFCNTRTSFYVKNEEYDSFLNRHVSDPRSGLVLVTGASGSGKTALLCSWLRGLQKADPDSILVYHFVGSTNSSTDLNASLSRIVKELSYQLKKDKSMDLEALEQQIEDSYNKLKKQDLSRNLKKVLIDISEASKKAIVIVDGLDKTAVRTNARPLFWLPSVIPEGIHIILSTQPSDSKTIEELRERWQVTDLVIESLTMTQQNLMCQQTLKLRGKELSESQLQTITEAENTKNPMFLKIVLEELCMFGKFRELDKKIESLVQCESSQELFEKYLERMEQDYNSVEYTGNLVEEVLCALFISRPGFTETDLMKMLEIPQHLWSPLYYGLQNYIITKSTLIGLAYGELGKAVFKRYIGKEENLLKFYNKQKVFYYNEVLNIPTATPERFSKIVESLHCAYKCQDSSTILQFITSPSTLGNLTNADSRSELLMYVQWLKKTQEELVKLFFDAFDKLMVKEYVLQQEEDLIQHPVVVPTLMNALDYLRTFLQFAQYHIACEKVLLRMKEIMTKNPNLYTTTTDIDYQLGSLYVQMKESKKGLPYYQTCINSFLTSNEVTPNKLNIGHVYSGMGNVYSELGEYEKAEMNFNLSEEHYKAFILTTNPHIYHREEIANGKLHGDIIQKDKSFFLDKGPAEMNFNLSEKHHKGTTLATNPTRDNDIYKCHAALALCKFNQGKYEEALEAFLKLLKEEEEIYFGELPLEHSHSLTHLGMVYRRLNNMPEAEKAYKKAMEIKKKICGDNHLDVAIGFVNLGNYARDNKDLPAAEEYFLKGLQVMRNIEGEDSPTGWLITENLMHCLILQRKFEEAYPYYSKVYEYVVSRDEFDKSLPTIHFTMAQVLAFQKGQPQQGYEVLCHLIRSKYADGDHFFFLDRIAKQLLYKGQSPLPIPFEVSLERCIQRFPDYMPAWETIITDDLLPTKDIDRIKAKIDDYYSVNGGYNDVQLLVLICQACVTVEWPEGSALLYEYFRPKFSPGNEVLLRNLAVAYASCGQIVKSVEVFQELITLKPDVWMFYDKVVQLRFKLEDYAGCREMVNTMGDTFPDLTEVKEKVTTYSGLLDEIDAYLKSQAEGGDNEGGDKEEAGVSQEQSVEKHS